MQIGFYAHATISRTQICVIMICMFSHWVKPFSCRKAAALTVGNIIGKIIPSWGIPSKLQSDQGTHFTGQIMQSICNILPILHFHCAYHPSSQDWWNVQMVQLTLN